VFTPTANYNGVVTFTYRVENSDGLVNDVDATVTVTINPVNDIPTTNDDAETTTEDNAVTIDVLANDDEDIDAIVALNEGPGINTGAFTITHVDGIAITDGGSSVSVDNGTVALVSGELVFTPTANYNGVVTFTYRVENSDGLANETDATVTVTVTAVEDNPVPADDSTSTDEDVAVVIDVLANDLDIDSNVTLNEELAEINNGSFVITHINGSPILVDETVNVTNGTVTYEDGKLTFTPSLDYFGPASFTYRVSNMDGNSNDVLDDATVSIFVNDTTPPVITVSDENVFTEVASGWTSSATALDNQDNMQDLMLL